MLCPKSKKTNSYTVLYNNYYISWLILENDFRVSKAIRHLLWFWPSTLISYRLNIVWLVSNWFNFSFLTLRWHPLQNSWCGSHYIIILTSISVAGAFSSRTKANKLVSITSRFSWLFLSKLISLSRNCEWMTWQKDKKITGISSQSNIKYIFLMPVKTYTVYVI